MNTLYSYQWKKLIAEYLINRSNKIVKYPRIKRVVRAKWGQILRENMDYLSNSHNFGEIYGKLEDLAEQIGGGIGPQTIYETAHEIADRNDISPDDSCWYFICNKIPIISQLGSTEQGPVDYFNSLSSEFEKLTSAQKIDFIVRYQRKIRRLAKSN